MLAYYVEWHMREAWRELTFADEDLEAKRERDPVAPAKRSKKALQKVASGILEDGSPVRSFRALLDEMGTIVRNTCVTRGAKVAASFDLVTVPTPAQRRALELLHRITV